MTTYGEERYSVWGDMATLLVTEPDRLEVARRAVDEVIGEIEAACGPQRADSELALVNSAGGRPVPVSATFHAVLWTAVHAAEVTQGLVDPTAGSGQGDWSSIRIDDPAGTVTLPPGMTLDFGSTARAFTADRAAELAAGRAECGVFLALGGDIAVAGPVPDQGWPVRVTEDDPTACEGQEIVLRAPGGLATSSLTLRTGTAATPRTGQRVQGPWRTISVAAGTCVDAGTAATAALVRGHHARDWLAGHHLPARLVHTDGWTTSVAGWPADADWPGVKVAG